MAQENDNGQKPAKPGYAAPLEGVFDNPATRLLMGVALTSVTLGFMRNYAMMMGVAAAAPLVAGKELAALAQNSPMMQASANAIGGPAAMMQNPAIQAPALPTPKMGGLGGKI